jgi:hypothetical protein
MKDILNTLSELLIKADAKMDPQSRMMDDIFAKDVEYRKEMMADVLEERRFLARSQD